MKGKVFESSIDVYQDQASVLFDFYLNAAQKIIDQEDACDNLRDAERCINIGNHRVDLRHVADAEGSDDTEDGEQKSQR